MRSRRRVRGRAAIAVADPPVVDLSDCTRHLTYHVWPVPDDKGTFDSLRWHIDQLRSRLDLFNGRRLVAIATDRKSMQFDECCAEFGEGFEFLHFRNKPQFREVVSWIPMLKTLGVGQLPPDEVVFSAHAKGCRYGAGTTREWSRMMYEGLLDRWDERVRPELEQAGAVGMFQKFGDWGGYQHHYSGTFLWHRAHGGRDWRYVPPRWWGVEEWVGHQYRPEHAACLFGQHVGDLYSPAINEAAVREFEEWNR